ncbi:MAG: cytochrome c biogenesis protein CcdA [Adlercreutzia equolifaciens]
MRSGGHRIRSVLPRHHQDQPLPRCEEPAGRAPAGIFSSVLFGVIFSVGWTPCVGAFLGSALMLASQQASVAQGVILLLCYFGRPRHSVCGGRRAHRQAEGRFHRHQQHYDIINKVCGWFLVAVGVLMATGLLGGFLRLLS